MSLPDFKLESVQAGIRTRIEPFLHEMFKNIPENPEEIYLTGNSARGEFDESNPEIHMLLVFGRIDSRLLDHIAVLGRRFGRNGIKAPLLLTSEYLSNAADSFPVELLELSNSHVSIFGEDRLSEIKIDISDLRLQCERDLRSWRLQLRQAYLRSAGEAAWMNEWFMDSISDVFPLLRAIIHLLGGDENCGNTETVLRLGALADSDLSAFSDAWRLRKNGARFDKKEVFPQFDRWENAFRSLVEKIDALETP